MQVCKFSGARQYASLLIDDVVLVEGLSHPIIQNLHFSTVKPQVILTKKFRKS